VYVLIVFCSLINATDWRGRCC